jgi:hypothetical protein
MSSAMYKLMKLSSKTEKSSISMHFILIIFCHGKLLCYGHAISLANICHEKMKKIEIAIQT